jgi:restriction endonuclease S subunit
MPFFWYHCLVAFPIIGMEITYVLEPFEAGTHILTTIFSSTTVAGREGLPKYNLEQFCVCIPPLAEQKQIVLQVNQLMAWCDALEGAVEERDRYRERMMQAVVKEVF